MVSAADQTASVRLTEEHALLVSAGGIVYAKRVVITRRDENIAIAMKINRVDGSRLCAEVANVFVEGCESRHIQQAPGGSLCGAWARGDC